MFPLSSKKRQRRETEFHPQGVPDPHVPTRAHRRIRDPQHFSQSLPNLRRAKHLAPNRLPYRQHHHFLRYDLRPRRQQESPGQLHFAYHIHSHRMLHCLLHHGLLPAQNRAHRGRTHRRHVNCPDRICLSYEDGSDGLGRVPLLRGRVSHVRDHSLVYLPQSDFLNRDFGSVCYSFFHLRTQFFWGCISFPFPKT